MALLESTENLSLDENACLRTLAFTEMHSREGRVELAAQNTGDWLLDDKDFQDWAQRKRLDEHHGFFWIQGKPGSGKSTLIKKAYSHLQDLSRDPTSIIAAFYFNARGSETEKSPAGLFRTLLHSLFQQLSGLRSRVMRVYRQKVAVLKSSWEWQFHELKEMLSSIVTVSVLGQRNLMLCIDALDECDLINAKSVIQCFESLASSSVREGTKFSVCLSSRYYPELTIQHCFKTGVERMNHGDILSYIQQHMEAVQAITHQSNQLTVLQTKLEKKASGTFLWVVLVVQELLIAYEHGATLGEIDRILDTVPSDLENFYRHQMQNTKHDDSHQMLSMLQCVFYSLRSLSPNELRYLLAFGHEGFSSYSKWAQHSEYVASQEQMAKRIREKSKGLIEIVESREDNDHGKRRMIVQFIHQSVRDFLSKDGFKSLRGHDMLDDAASGHEFIKTACLNYLNVTELRKIPSIDCRFYSTGRIRAKLPTLADDHPLLEYAVVNLFPHAALAERHGVQQDSLRSLMSDNIEGSFERWRNLSDLVFSPEYGVIQGPKTRPLHVFAEYGLLAPGLTRLEGDPNIEGGRFHYPLLAAACMGHEDVVRCLLNSGADPNVMDPFENTACHLAASGGHVSILKSLLEHPQLASTIQQRVTIAGQVLEGTIHDQEILALLIPKSSVSVSVIDQICETGEFRRGTVCLLRWMIDNCEIDVLEHKHLWYECVKDARLGMSSIQSLLDGVGCIEICEELLHALSERDCQFYDYDRLHENDVDKIAMILFNRGSVEVTESLVDKISEWWNSSQIILQLAELGSVIPPITHRQTLTALSNGSPESVGFFVQRAPDAVHSDEILLAAIQNPMGDAQAARILLGLRSIDRPSEATVISILESQLLRPDVLATFEDCWGRMFFPVEAVVAALSKCNLKVVEFVFSRCERFNVTEKHIIAALRNGTEVVDLVLKYDPSFRVQDELVAETVAKIDDPHILNIYLDHGNTLLLTENVVKAAVRNRYTGFEALEIIFQHDSSAKVSRTMVLEALRSVHDASLITLMLEKDPSISMEEDFLIAAASNIYESALIFEALHAKSRIDFGNSTVEAALTPPAKRQRIASNRSTLVRNDRIKSTPITRKVIEAAAANPNEKQRSELQSLFQTWGVLTNEDLELFHSTNNK